MFAAPHGLRQLARELATIAAAFILMALLLPVPGVWEVVFAAVAAAFAVMAASLLSG